MGSIEKSVRYDNLFSSGIEFAFRVELCEKGEIEGCSDSEIEAYSKKINSPISPAVWSYIRHFGEKARAKDTDYNCAYSLADFNYALHEANRREEWHEMMTFKEFLATKNFKVNYDEDYPTDNEGLYTPEITSLVNIDTVFPFSYDSYTRCFKFLDNSEENPIIYNLTRYYILTSEFITMTNSFRRILFLYVMKYAPYDFAELGLIDGKTVPISAPIKIDSSGGFEFLKFYEELTKRAKFNWPRLSRLRERFCFLHAELEKKGGPVLSFMEFENKFVEFLQKNKFEY